MDLRITVNDLKTAQFLQDVVMDGWQAANQAAWENIAAAKTLEEAHRIQAEHDDVCAHIGSIINRLGVIVGHLEERALATESEK